jgi:hypothetical protein
VATPTGWGRNHGIIAVALRPVNSVEEPAAGTSPDPYWKRIVAVAPPALDLILTAQPAGLPVRVKVNGPLEVTGLPGSGRESPVRVTVPVHSIPGVAMK